MIAFFTHVVHRYGYLAVAMFVTLEGFGVPLPGETAIVTAAAFAAGGTLNIYGVIIAATIGSVLGGSGGYWIGRIGGRGLLIRHGHWVRLSPERLASTESYFARHGAATVFLARFIALLRIFGALIAGVAHMPFPTFSVVNLAGGILWSATFATLGFVFGKNIDVLENYITEFTIAVTSIIVFALLVIWWRRSRRSA
jgi:membrane protein DedA with SNARE-associated domain